MSSDSRADTAPSIWRGEKVLLRAIEPEDWEAFHAFDQDTEVARAAYFIPFPRSTADSKRWAREQSEKEPENDQCFWVIERLDSHAVAGSINTLQCDRRNGTFRYGLGLGRQHWRHGFASDAIRLVLRYYFDELGYQKVNAGVYAFNGASIALHESLGFTQEGRLRRMFYSGGEHHDEITFGMTADEFRELHGDGR